MIKKNGRGFITFNLARMIEKSQSPDIFNKANFDFDKFVRDELKDMPFTYKVFDVDLSVYDAFMDGNIRLVIQK